MMRSRSLLSRASVACALVAFGVALSGVFLSQTVASQDHAALAAAHTAAGCGKTWVRGLTENRSPIAMQVTQTGHHLGNEWCREASDEVRPHSTDTWLAGDESGGETQIHIIYRLSNHDKILFQARASEDRPAEVGCRFIDVVRTPREYECQAEVVAGVSGIAAVRFSVLAVRR